MEEDKVTAEGTKGDGLMIHVETIYSPSQAMMKAAAAMGHQIGARSKELVPGQATQPNPALWGEVTGAALPQEALTETLQQSQRMAWDPSGPAECRQSREWGFPLLSRSQSLAGFPEQFSQLNVSSLDQSSGIGQHGWILPQPKFTFPAVMTVTPPSGASTSFHLAKSRWGHTIPLWV